ncbi:MAG: hypothetical protein WC845_02830 [Candidatus Staskawiczbacteria bacterium]|jgi:hypothetical protein
MKTIIKKEVVRLRKIGKTYSEILQIISPQVAKSTISNWCRNIILTPTQEARISNKIEINLANAQLRSLAVRRLKRKDYLDSVEHRVKHLKNYIKKKDAAKIALAMLYLGEGSKGLHRGSLCFGNSDPVVISLFLRLLRKCYSIDERKFRCTVQCRADQDTTSLNKFWRGITKIPKSQFYKARIDPRTTGKVSKKGKYKGVCRIDYFSADIFTELQIIPQVVFKGS